MPPPRAAEPLIDEGGWGVGLAGLAVGQTEPGSLCADHSLPWSSCMVPPQNRLRTETRGQLVSCRVTWRAGPRPDAPGRARHIEFAASSQAAEPRAGSFVLVLWRS